VAYSWEEMIEQFRKLGGTADNLIQRVGSRGRGIFPIDNTKPVRLRVPRNLLVPIEDIQFVDDQLRIQQSAAIGTAERDFIEKYENEFSWGGGGRSDCAVFLEGMKRFHLDIPHESRSKSFVTWMANGVDSPVGQRFLNSRSVKYGNKTVLMPVMELVNHGPSANGYDIGDDISIKGEFADEVLVRYSDQDSLGVFMSYGFASPEPMAFSLPLNFKGTRELVIERKINLDAKLGSFSVPTFTITESKVTLSSLVIGSSAAPRVPKSIFLTILESAGWQNPAEEFERACHQNRMICLGLLETADAQEGHFALTFRKMLYFQLKAMSHCFGTRTL